MMRFISGLLLLVGLAAAAYGGFRLLQEGPQGAVGPVSSPASSPVPESVTPEAVQAPDVPELGEAPTQEELDAFLEDINNIETAAGGNVEVDADAAGAPQPRIAEASEPMFRGASQPAAAPPPPPPPPPAPSSEDRADSAASFAERLYQVPVAYETPETAAFQTPFNVTFAIDGTGDTTAVDALPGQDSNVVSGTAKISDRVKASLIGSAFEIELTSPEVQRVSLLTENVWRWQVTPIESGEHSLVLELFALEGDEAVPLRTYSDQVVVSVSSFQKAISLATTANPLFVVLGGIGSALGGFFGVFKFFRRT